MNCPNCMNIKSRCTDSRQIDGTTRRRRACQVCNHRWTTYELSLEEATHIDSENPSFDEPLTLMRDMVNLTMMNRRTVYAVIRGLLARQAIDEIKGKDAA